MKKQTIMNSFTLLIRLALGFLFLYAPIDKILHPAQFAQVIYNYRVLPVELVNIVAIIVPWIEVGIGLTLLFGFWVETSAFIMNVLTLFFIGLIFSAMIRGLNIECGCFSLDSANSLVGWKRIFEDVLILAGGIVVFRNAIKKLPVKNEEIITAATADGGIQNAESTEKKKD